MIICSDVDGVILNYIQGFIDFTIEEDIPYQYNPELYGVIRGVGNESKLRKRFHDGDFLRRLVYYEGALEVLNTLVKINEVHLVTALDPDCSNKRAENLSRLNYTSMQCVGDADKERIIIEEVKPDVMLEDRPELIQAFNLAGLKVFYPDWHLYTQGMAPFGTPFSCWKQLPQLLKQFSVTGGVQKRRKV